MTWVQSIPTSPSTASLTSLWSMGLGRHSPLTRHATVPSTLSSEGLLVLLKTTSKSLCYSPCSSELTPPGKRGICGTEAHYYDSSVTLALTGCRPSPSCSRSLVSCSRCPLRRFPLLVGWSRRELCREIVAFPATSGTGDHTVSCGLPLLFHHD